MTPVGVRDGDPDALAGLCDRRGPAVLAYCTVVAGQQHAVAAAAEAFASFRAGVVAAGDLANLNPEALLVSATRHSAGRYAGSDAPQACARVPALLAARADRSITLADHDWLQEHLPGCWTCRAPVSRFEAANRAYVDPPATPLAPETTAAIVAAMTAAAPVRGAEPPPPPAVPEAAESTYEIHAEGPPASLNGAAAHGGDALEADYVDQPTAAWQIGVDDVDVHPEYPAQPAPERASRLGLLSAGLGHKLRGGRRDAGHDSGQASAAAAAADAPAAEPRRTSGSRLPRKRHAEPAAPATGSKPGRLRPGIVLPIALVLVAIVVALVVAGVFGRGENASTPQSLAPGSSPSSQTVTSPDAVPGAENATSAAIEREKARRRAANRKPTTTASSPNTDAADPSPAPTPAPATPAASAKPDTSTPADRPAPTGGGGSPNSKPDNGGGGGATSTAPKPGGAAQAPAADPPTPSGPATEPGLPGPAAPPLP